MKEIKVSTFFYGSYMNPAVLKEVDIIPERIEVARLSGYDICIQPRANLIRSGQHSVYGVVVAATHAELMRLYAHSQNVLGESYAPEPVLVQTNDQKWLPVLCYISHSIKPCPATDDAYIERIVQPARDFGSSMVYPTTRVLPARLRTANPIVV
jgi:hypothetical protein